MSGPSTCTLKYIIIYGHGYRDEQVLVDDSGLYGKGDQELVRFGAAFSEAAIALYWNI
jgi:hypothetical protein